MFNHTSRQCPKRIWICWICVASLLLLYTLGFSTLPVITSRLKTLLVLKTYRAKTFVRNHTLLEQIQAAQTNQTMDNLPCHRALPNCLLVGVMKCGTQALTDFLTIHPDIAMKRDDNKVNFFNKFYEYGDDWYRQHMSCSKPGQITIEKTPEYFKHRKAPERIYHLDKNMKILIIVRNPFRRAISHYHQILSANPQKLKGSGTFDDQVLLPNGNVDTEAPVIKNSIYSTPFKVWLGIFPRENLHIVDGDMLTKDVVVEYRKIEKFLNLPRSVRSDSFVYDVEKGFFCLRGSAEGENICLSPEKGRQHITPNPITMEKLKKYFRPYNQDFMKLADQRFDWDLVE